MTLTKFLSETKQLFETEHQIKHSIKNTFHLCRNSCAICIAGAKIKPLFHNCWQLPIAIKKITNHQNWRRKQKNFHQTVGCGTTHKNNRYDFRVLIYRHTPNQSEQAERKWMNLFINFPSTPTRALHHRT